MDSDTGRLGLWIPRELHGRMKALAKELGRAEGRRIELRELYSVAFSRLADRIDTGEPVEFKVDRRERVRVSLVVSASLLERLNTQRTRLRVLKCEYAVAALGGLLDHPLSGHRSTEASGQTAPAGAPASGARAHLAKAVPASTHADSQASTRRNGARSAR